MRGKSRLIRLLRPAGWAMIGGLVAGCALLAPLPRETTLDQRLADLPVAGLPVEGRVTVHWNEQQVPYIEAERDADLPVALGFVHAHLRLGQMEILRRISQGRIAEMGGPLAADIDVGLRILNFGRAAAATEAALSPESRAWIEGFVRGVNHYQRNARRLPHEFRVLGLAREPWTVRDVLTFGRLSGTDVNWLVYAGLLKLRQRDDWPALWTRLIRHGTASVPSFDGDRNIAAFGTLLSGVSKSGSNSVAVAPARSKTGGALMANDPHLGITLPNIWLIAGVRSPSYNVVGLMVPGLPIFAIGRNPWIAWGGTNMRAASSDLVDVSGLKPEKITTRRETVRVRWWFDRSAEIRETEWGPVLSDAPLLKDSGAPPFAVRWTGHRPSDEIAAMLKVAKARNFGEFREAFRTFAVSGQNMLYADTDGNIGQVMAVQLPARPPGTPPDMIRQPADVAAAWRKTLGATDLPFSFNPPDGVLMSANNRPAAARVPVGYFFSPDDRMIRMREILDRHGRVGIAEIGALQRDVAMPSALRLRDLFVAALDSRAAAAAGHDRVVALMKGWDGRYAPDSRGALAFELFHAPFREKFYALRLGDGDAAAITRNGNINGLLAEDIGDADAATMDSALGHALAQATAALGDFADWGDMHRLGIAHPLSFLPVIGGRYRFADHPVGGSSHTLMKTAHAATAERHFTRYGSNARHISDLSDPDANYFVLLGGQDGWLNSANFTDQVPQWLAGEYIRVPLRPETARRSFTRRTEIAPAR